MKPFHYYNPVRIEFGRGRMDILPELVGQRRALLVTTSGFIKRGLLDRLKSIAPQLVEVVSDIPSNPTFDSLRPIYDNAWKHDFDVIVAVGGGSVLDGAKALSVGCSARNFQFVENLIRGAQKAEAYRLTPIIAIPTTAGTGSEVTPWATIWDMEARKKFSLHLPDLWSEWCLCDPELTVSLPADITLHTALDALSQALEAIWNKNANPISTSYSILSARTILSTLPRLVHDLSNVNRREEILLASLQTGLSFSNTQTAVAHAISYYVTAHKGTPHGVACSFTLPAIVDTVAGRFPEVDAAFQAIWGDRTGRELRQWMTDLGVGTRIQDYGLSPDDMEKIRASLTGNPRANNSLVPVDSLFQRLLND